MDDGGDSRFSGLRPFPVAELAFLARFQQKHDRSLDRVRRSPWGEQIGHCNYPLACGMKPNFPLAFCNRSILILIEK